MDLERKWAGNVAILAFSGELDAARVPGVQREIDALIDTGYRRLVFNFGRLTFADSTGLAQLIVTVKQLRQQDGELVLSELSDFLQTILKTLGLDQVLKIFPNDVDAVRYFHDSGGGDAGVPSRLSPWRPSDSGAARPPGEEGTTSP